jgi:hypothetical protein
MAGVMQWLHGRDGGVTALQEHIDCALQFSTEAAGPALHDRLQIPPDTSSFTTVQWADIAAASGDRAARVCHRADRSKPYLPPSAARVSSSAKPLGAVATARSARAVAAACRRATHLEAHFRVTPIGEQLASLAVAPSSLDNVGQCIRGENLG